MAGKESGRNKMFVFIRVLTILVLCSQCLAKVPGAFSNESITENLVSSPAAANSPSGLGDGSDDAEDASDEGSGDDGDDDDANAVTRGRPGGMTDTKWNSMGMEAKIAFWNGESAKELNKACDTLEKDIIPKAQKEHVPAPAIEYLKKTTEKWRSVGAKIKENQLTEKFMVRQDLLAADAKKIKSRQTPESQQKAERALAAVQAIGQGVKNIKDNWGKPGKEWEIAKDISTMLSGVLAVIPSPHTKALAVFLDVVSSLIGVFGPSVQDPTEAYIDHAVERIVTEFNAEKLVHSRAKVLNLKAYWKFASTYIKEPIPTEDEWNDYMVSDSLPDAKAHIIPTTKAKEWVTRNLANGADPEINKDILLSYYRMCQLIDQTFTRVIQMMPHENVRQSLVNIWNFYQDNQFQLRKDAVEFTTSQVFVINRYSALTLHHIYPPKINAMSTEIFTYIEGLTYLKGDVTAPERGEVIGVTGTPKSPAGEFYLESASSKGYYVTLVPDWSGYVQKVEEREEHWVMGGGHTGIGPGALRYGWGYQKTRSYDLGVMIRLRAKKTHHMIKISNVDSESEVKTMTFKEDDAKIEYLEDFKPSGSSNPKKKRFIAESPYLTYDMPLFAPTNSIPTSSHQSGTLKNCEEWKIIPLKKEKGDPGDPVMIGNAKGTYFWTVDSTSICLKPLAPEKDGDKHRVHKKNIFYLHKEE